MEQVPRGKPAFLWFVKGETFLAKGPYISQNHISSQMLNIWLYSYQNPFLLASNQPDEISTTTKQKLRQKIKKERLKEHK